MRMKFNKKCGRVIIVVLILVITYYTYVLLATNTVMKMAKKWQQEK